MMGRHFPANRLRADRALVPTRGSLCCRRIPNARIPRLACLPAGGVATAGVGYPGIRKGGRPKGRDTAELLRPALTGCGLGWSLPGSWRCLVQGIGLFVGSRAGIRHVSRETWTREQLPPPEGRTARERDNYGAYVRSWYFRTSEWVARGRRAMLADPGDAMPWPVRTPWRKLCRNMQGTWVMPGVSVMASVAAVWRTWRSARSCAGFSPRPTNMVLFGICLRSSIEAPSLGTNHFDGD
jgi:hypothetical protein